MKLSTKGRYGVRLMLDLAGKYGKGPISLKDIAGRQEISEKYLWHLTKLLKNAGLVRATRGMHGGYALARPPEQVSLKEIVSVLEGPMCLVECTADPRVCKRSSDCTARQVWAEVTEKIMSSLSSYSLEDMLKMQKSKRASMDYAIQPILLFEAEIEQAIMTIEKKKTLDLRGIYCPLNMVKTRLAMEKLAMGGELDLLFDDTSSLENVAKGLEKEGHVVKKMLMNDNDGILLVERR